MPPDEPSKRSRYVLDTNARHQVYRTCLQSTKNALFRPDGRGEERFKEIPFTDFGLEILGATCLVTFPTVAVVVESNCVSSMNVREQNRTYRQAIKRTGCTYHLETWRRP